MDAIFQQVLTDYILSAHAYLHVPTPEKARFTEELKEISAALPPDGRPVFTWSPATGWRDQQDKPAKSSSGGELGPPQPQLAPQQILDLPEEAIFLMKDFGFYLNPRTFSYSDLTIGWLTEIRDVLAHTGRTVLFIGVDFEIPPALQHEITTIEFKLPDDAAIEKAVRFVADGHGVDESAMPAIVTACKGMTQQQVEDRTALALRRFKALNADAARLILNEKAQVIRQTGLLDYRDPPAGGLDLIGGWENVKRHVQRDKPCFGAEAREFGIEFPRGLLLVGVSGGGKTQMSLCIASYLGLPLIQMDVGSLMSKYVGESERNTREAIRMLEGLGSCVLQLDEIEKGFGGVGGEQDGGAAQRSFGIFLKWLNDRTCPVYVVATANNIRSLPPEFSRKGRFSEIYGVYLPTLAERIEILGIHLTLRGLDPQKFDVPQLAHETDSYTGADLKEVVQMALQLAFHAGKPLGDEHLMAAIPEVRPLAKTDPEAVTAITQWLDVHAKPAGCAPAAPTLADKSSRKRRVSLN